MGGSAWKWGCRALAQLRSKQCDSQQTEYSSGAGAHRQVTENHTWSRHAAEHCSALKRREISAPAPPGAGLEDVVLREPSQTRKPVPGIPPM